MGAEKENSIENFEIHNNEFIGDLASFFDLLAKFDYQDKQKEKLALNPDLLASAPRGRNWILTLKTKFMEGLNNNRKKKGWFKVGNLFFDEHAKNIRYTASIVYLCIKRYMDNDTRIAFPSEKLIAEKLGMDRRTVIRAIKKLESHKFIIKEKSKYKGLWEHNSYYLTDSQEWLSQPFEKDIDNHVTNMSYPGDKKYKNHVHKSHINNTYIKNTNNKKD